MRDIKFRGQALETNVWIYSNGFLKHSNGKVALIVSEFEDGCVTSPIIPETLGEFTGLKDKNGKEIYEGDILRTDNIEIERVEYFQAYAGFCRIYKDWVYDMNDNGNYEVIGNIFENKDLLK